MAPWPLPRDYQHASSVVWLAPEVDYVFRSPGSDQEAFMVHMEPGVRSPISPKELLAAAFNRMKDAIFSERFVPYKFYPRGTEFEPGLGTPKAYVRQIIFEQHAQIDLDESYEAHSLDISEDGRTLIRAISIQGALHALTTFSQLFYGHSSSSVDTYTPYAPLTIKDSPKFEHRGLNLDIARNRISPTAVKSTLDSMSFTKFNRLHLHASDSQSWPIDIPTLPELALKGAYHKSQIWSAADLKDVQEYGTYRGIEVYIEIGTPGHTGSIFHAYPELITAYNAQPWQDYAAEPPAGQLKLNYPQVPVFLTKLFGDLLPRVSPYTSHFHVGGDELNTNAYSLDPTVNSASADVIKPLLQAFYDHVFSLTTSSSLTPLAWEEIVLDWDLKLPKSTIIQTWRDESSLASVVAKGYRALFGIASYWYLDCGFGSWVDPDPSDPHTSVKPPYLDWCSPYKNWRHIYTYDPLVGIPEEHEHLVIGGEVHLWSELTDSVMLDGKLWPRAAAAAEVLWKGRRDLTEDVTRRLAELRERLIARGVGADMVQMEWCLSNPGASLL